jgi:predicted phage terminase large subunit-like protein
MDRIFDKYRQYRHLLIGFETVAFQKVLKMWLDERSRREGVYLPVREVNQGGISKEARITRLSPLVENGTIWFVKGRTELLVEQLLRFPKADHDDGPDALEGAVSILQEAGARSGTGLTGGRVVGRSAVADLNW